MRVLRLGNSDDLRPGIPDESRSWHLAARRLEELTGERVDTTVKVTWPSAELPDVVQGWLERLEPDLVMIVAGSFSVMFPSLALRCQQLPVIGPKLARAGLKAADASWFAHTAPVRFARHTALTLVGGLYYFEPAEVAGIVEEVLRRTLRYEQIAVCVRGPSPLLLDAPVSLRRQAEQRRLDLHRRCAVMCSGLHVPYHGWDAPLGSGARARRLGDSVHLNPAGHAERAPEDAELMLRAWRQKTELR